MGLTLTSTGGHTGERPCKHNVCYHACLQFSDQRDHQRVHTREKPYTHAVCGMESAHGATLQGHSRVHTKEKDVRKGCGKRFPFPYPLRLETTSVRSVTLLSDSRGLGSET